MRKHRLQHPRKRLHHFVYSRVDFDPPLNSLGGGAARCSPTLPCRSLLPLCAARGVGRGASTTA
eukprot:1656104-Rhodomonas_salina.1